MDRSQRSAIPGAKLISLTGRPGGRTGADTALDTATAFRPQIVFLDIGMPDMDGYEVARRLRQRPELEEPVLVAVNGFGRDEDHRLAADAGFDQHVTKPLDLAALPALLARVGDRR